MNAYNKIIDYCADLLENSPDANNVATYLNNRVSKGIQRKFSFGYFPDNKGIKALTENVGEELLGELSLLYDRLYNNGNQVKERHAAFENHNLIMPWKNVYGEIIALVGRSILDDEKRAEKKISKYKNTSFDKRKHLFGFFEGKNEIIKRNTVFLVEGQFDCIAAHDKGMENVVAIGSSNLAFDQCALLLRYTDNFVLLLDADDAGRAGNEKAIKQYSKYANIKIGALPENYKDLCEFLASNSPEYFNQYIS
jgi:DNA primase